MAASTIERATWVDDDGSGETGTVVNNARLQNDIYAKIDALLSGARANPLVLGGNLSLEGGYLRFPGTHVPSTGVNDLDEYEEGSWSPVLSAASGSGATHSLNSGRYTRIGRHVFVQARFTVSSIGTLSGNARVAGLPFPAIAGNTDYGTITLGFWGTMNVSAIYMSGLFVQAQSYIDLYYNAAAAVSLSSLQASHFQNGSEIYFTGHYIT